MGFFNKEVEHHYHIVEVDKTTKLPELTGDLRESLKVLYLQHSFQYIMQRFRLKKAAMETTLKEGFNLPEKQLQYCQATIFWAGKIERDIKILTQESSQTRPASVDEMAAFKQVAKSITLVGQEETPQG